MVACEFSGVVRDAFIKRGHDAVSCDLLPTERPGPHIQGDVLEHLNDGWDLMIAHPPCTRLCNSGVRWLHERNLWNEMYDAAQFFRRFIQARDIIPHIAIENPIPHKYAVAEIGVGYDQLIQPWMFGHGETKATCLWLYSLSPLFPTNRVSGREGKVWKQPPSPQRAHIRSITYQGIADAMAEQWGGIAWHVCG